jgi:hypothetical protein
MAKQPRARQAKSKSRQDAFHVLTDKAKSGPKKDNKISFGDVKMARQGKKVLIMKVRETKYQIDLIRSEHCALEEPEFEHCAEPNLPGAATGLRSRSQTCLDARHGLQCLAINIVLA